MKLDKLDIRILNELQQNGALSNLELAERVGLSPSPCARRVKNLQEAGIIEKTISQLNAQKLGLGLMAMVMVTLKNHMPETLNNFDNRIERLLEVQECNLLTGSTADYLLKVVVADMQAYQNFILKKLTIIDSVRDIHSSFVMRQVIKPRGLNI